MGVSINYSVSRDMGTFPLSIIIPVYNVEKYIDKCISSIVNQGDSFNNVELIIVNDGTKDNSIAVIQSYIDTFPNVFLINQENAGLSEARNTGLRHATGKYVWFFDSDDWMPDNCLDKILNVLGEKQSQVFLFQMDIYHEEVYYRTTYKDIPSISECRGADLLSLSFKAVEGYVPTQIYITSRDFLNKTELKFLKGVYHEDMDFCPRLLLSAEVASYVDLPIYCYRIRSTGSITTDDSLFFKRKKSYMKVFDNLSEFRYKNCDENIFDRVMMVTACGFFNDFTYNQWMSFNEDVPLSGFIRQLKKVVFRNLKNANGVTHVIRLLIFIASPTLLKYFGKKI